MTDEDIQKFADTITESTNYSHGMRVSEDKTQLEVIDLDWNTVAVTNDPEKFYKFIESIKNS